MNFYPDMPERSLVVRYAHILNTDSTNLRLIGEVENWCLDTLKESLLLTKEHGQSFLASTGEIDLVHRVVATFYNEADLIAFKLRWL